MHTTVRADLQQAAQDALLKGLRTYDWRHGWRGPERRLAPREDESAEDTLARWQEALRAMPTIAKLPPGIVTDISESQATVLTKSGESVTPGKAISRKSVAIDPSANHRPRDYAVGAARPRRPDPHAGRIRHMASDAGTQGTVCTGFWTPRRRSRTGQRHGIRTVEIQPGYQAASAGTNFKPFLYASALEAGITPSTVINDAPVVLDNLAAAESGA